MTFSTEAMVSRARQEVVAEARSWLRTPYHHHARVKGVGVDCAMFLAEVYERTGLVEHVETGHYPHDWHDHRDEEMFIAWVQRVGCVPIEKPQSGDIALFRFGRTFSHGGVMADTATVIHSYLGMGVCTHRLDEAPLARRVVQFWSPPWAANSH